MVSIPFNVCLCNKCSTPQLKYLGIPSEVYKHNHADGTGETMNLLHKENLSLVNKYISNIDNIIEIGSSKGLLADMILSENDLKYYVIDPAYFGDISNKIIIEDFYENVNDSELDANTIICSHVFEHFYKPMDILSKVSSNANIENFFLVFPDLEYYIKNDIHHVLNTEHTFYIDNSSLISLFKSNGFDLVERRNFRNHSVLLYFKRAYRENTKYQPANNSNLQLVHNYYKSIFDLVDRFNGAILDNKDRDIYLWPASIHSLYLSTFGLEFSKLRGLLDNSPNKINKKMYGTNLEVFNFKEIVDKKDQNVFIILNGGVFNSEVEKQLDGCKYMLAKCNIFAICGDSGSGKTTLSNHLRNIYRESFVLECDRYHKWERCSDNWNSSTHLNPKSNNLNKMKEDISNLKIGKEIRQVDYDHKSGNFTDSKVVSPANNIIVCGLHSLLKNHNMYNLKIYMDTDESLKKEWKVLRDTIERDKLEEEVLRSIESRKSDYEKYIVPQKDKADLVVKFSRNCHIDRRLSLSILINKLYSDTSEIQDILRLFINSGVKFEYAIDDSNFYTIYFHQYEDVGSLIDGVIPLHSYYDYIIATILAMTRSNDGIN